MYLLFYSEELLYYSEEGVFPVHATYGLLGVYSTKDKAESARNEHNKLCGNDDFNEKEHGNLYYIEPVVLDKDRWKK